MSLINNKNKNENENEKLLHLINDEIINIYQFVTYECLYNTVIEVEKEKGKGILNFFKNERNIWMENKYKVKFGIDVNKVKIEIKENHIICTLPKAEMFGEPELDVESIKENIVSKEGLIKNHIKIKDFNEKIKEAKEELKNKASSNALLLYQTKRRAKMLLESYIKNILRISNINYMIDFAEA